MAWPFERGRDRRRRPFVSKGIMHDSWQSVECYSGMRGMDRDMGFVMVAEEYQKKT